MLCQVRNGSAQTGGSMGQRNLLRTKSGNTGVCGTHFDVKFEAAMKIFVPSLKYILSRECFKHTEVSNSEEIKSRYKSDNVFKVHDSETNKTQKLIF